MFYVLDTKWWPTEDQAAKKQESLAIHAYLHVRVRVSHVFQFVTLVLWSKTCPLHMYMDTCLYVSVCTAVGKYNK